MSPAGAGRGRQGGETLEAAGLPCTCGRPPPHLTRRRHPAGARRSMAASKLVQEIHSIGDRLLLKLQRLPQAEPVEVLAFSVLVVFTATVVLLLLIACGFCCCQYCWPRRRGRRTQVGPMTLP